jgi:hypothetical protein
VGPASETRADGDADGKSGRRRRPAPKAKRNSKRTRGRARRSSKGVWSGSVYLLTASVILAALITLRAELLSSEARDAWARATQAEAQRGGYLVQSADWVFNAVGAEIFIETEATLLRDQFRTYAMSNRGRVRAALLTESRIESRTLRRIQSGLDIYADSDLYLQSPGYYHYADHLSNELRTVVFEPPDRAQKEGDQLATGAALTMSLNLGAALAFLAGTISEALPRRKRLGIIVGFLVLGGTILAAAAFELVVQ